MLATTTAEKTILAADAEVDTPALIVSEEILHNNVSRMASFARSAGVQLRPHIKTHKTPQITRLQIAAGAIGVTCAKVGEAEVMVNEAGAQDVLIAYPTVGASKYERLVKLMDKARIIQAVDSLAAAKLISKTMSNFDVHMDVVIEVNTGQNRSGVFHGTEAVELAKKIARLPNLHLVGVMTHEGQANSADPADIDRIATQAGEDIVATAEAIRAEGIDLEIVSVGSTPAAFITARVKSITEMRPGTYVFNDNSAFRYGHLGVNDMAARFVATVVSRPAPDRAVLDTGSKSLAMDPSKSHPGHGYIVGHPEAVIVKLSEEHGVVLLPDGEAGFEVGDRVEVIPNHICPTVNLMDEMLIVRDGHVVDTWKIAARGKVR
ncbi:MAG TPA: alanine racemase [Thermomicrobiales bacterium]|nr:alanine racemase [Thermomicrobiales bacterium]